MPSASFCRSSGSMNSVFISFVNIFYFFIRRALSPLRIGLTDEAPGGALRMGFSSFCPPDFLLREVRMPPMPIKSLAKPHRKDTVESQLKQSRKLRERARKTQAHTRKLISELARHFLED